MDLQDKLGAVALLEQAKQVLEQETAELRQAKQVLGQQLAQRDTVLAQLGKQVEEQKCQLESQDKQIKEQQRIIEQHQQQAKLKSSQALDLQALTGMIRASLAEASSPLQDTVLQHIVRACSLCCMELRSPALVSGSAEAPAVLSCC